jgi:D-tyrosyl-tRNA(Tyr) deacylase
MGSPYLILVSSEDPVAVAVAARWGTPESTGWMVDGTAIRSLSSGALLLRRPGRHIHDERVDLRLPTPLREQRPTLVFPSIHRSEQNVECLTVHPLGNPGPLAEVGGRPRVMVPTDPHRMTGTLRALDERARGTGLSVTFEATHHGPEVALPAFFVEIGFGTASGPSEEAVRILADVIPEILPDPADRVALGVGGGHYAPHFTDLARKRRWAFGHLISRHSLAEIDGETASAAWAGTERAEGILYARAEDSRGTPFETVARRLRDGEAPRRAGEVSVPDASRSASGT